MLSDELIALGRWIAGYYCAPLGEVLRSMLPLAADIRSGKIYSLTDAGRDASKQLSIAASADDDVNQVMQMLAARSLSAAHLKRKIPLADKHSEIARDGVAGSWSEEVRVERDPLRAPSAKLRIDSDGAPSRRANSRKPNGNCSRISSLHPGTHNLGDLEDVVRQCEHRGPFAGAQAMR